MLHPATRFSIALLILTAEIGAQQPAAGVASVLDRAIATVRAEIASGNDVWEDHSTWANAWRARAPHFEVRTTQSYDLGKRVADGLEVMMAHFQETLATDYAPAQALPVLILPDIGAYNAFGEEHGTEHSSFYGSFFAVQHPEHPVAVAYNDNPTYLRMEITHSVVHQWLAQAFPGSRAAPLWLQEGLAAYFSIYWDYGWGVDEIDRIRGGDDFVPLRNLLGDPVAAYGRNSHARMIELGMLFYYLLRYRDDTRTSLPAEAVQQSPFRDYIVALLEGRDATQLPVHQLTTDLPALEADFRDYQFPR